MTPTMTTGRRRRGLGGLGIAALALLTLAGAALAQSPAPVGSPAPVVARAGVSPAPSIAPEDGRRIIACPRPGRRERWQGRRPGAMGDRDGCGPANDGRCPVRHAAGRTSDRDARSDPSCRASSGYLRGSRPSRPSRAPRVTLVTPDGWSRSVDTTGIPIIRGGTQIGIPDLRVGDAVLVRQRRGDDGTWQVSRLRVMLTTLRGTVAGVTPDGFELETRRGDHVSVRVSAMTTWVLGCATDPDAPLEAGTRVVARGVGASDGALDATVVAAAGPARRRHARGERDTGPIASPAPSAAPSGVAPSA